MERERGRKMERERGREKGRDERRDRGRERGGERGRNGARERERGAHITDEAHISQSCFFLSTQWNGMRPTLT